MTDITEGIVFRQIKSTGGRRMLLIFTEKYGKISCGAFARRRKKNSTETALSVFTLGEYDLSKRGAIWTLNRAETLETFYGLGEDPDRFAAASYGLEITERMLPEGLPNPRLFQLLKAFLKALEKRKSHYLTLVLMLEIKALVLAGAFADPSHCVRCGSGTDLRAVGVAEGGLLCGDCCRKLAAENRDSLIFPMDFDIVKTISYLIDRPAEDFEKLALDDEAAAALQKAVREYMSYHLDISSLKSESMFEGVK